MASCAPATPPEAPEPTPAAAAAPAATREAASSTVLALLPDGEVKRTFLLDCTGCHQMGREYAFPDGAPRSAAAWQEVVERMLGYAGPESAFPVISAHTEAAATAAWLAEHWGAVPPAAPPVVPSPAVREFDYPYAQDLPHDLAVDAAGRVVITGMFTHRMLVLDPGTGEFEEVEIPVEGANPRALEIDAAGDWWVLLGAPQQVARYRPGSGEWTTWDVGVYGHSVRVDGEGRAWYNGHFTRDPVTLGYVDGASGEVRTFAVPTPPELQADAGPIPYGLRIGPDGRVWSTELQGNRLIAFDPRSGRFESWILPTSRSGPRRLDVGPDGRVWVPEYSGNHLAVFDPATETFTEHELPIPDALPYVARVHPATGDVWVATGAADAVLVFDPGTAAWRTLHLPTRGALVRDMDADRRTGDVWLAYGAAPGIPPRIAHIAADENGGTRH